MTLLAGPARDVRRARAAVAVAFFAHGVVSGSWASRIPWVQDARGLSTAALGIALLGGPVGAVLALPVAGRLVARHGSRPVTRTLFVALCLALPLPALAPDVGLLMLALVVWGAASGALDVAMNAHGVAVEGRYRRPVLSSFHGMWSVGSLGGALVGAAMAAGSVSAPVHFAVVSAGLLVGGPVALRPLLPAGEDATGSPVRGRPRRPSRRLFVLGLVALCALFAEGVAADWTAVWFAGPLHTTAAVGALGFAVFSLAMTAGRFGGDRVVAAVGPVRFLRWSGGLAAAGFALGLLAGTVPVALLGLALLGLGIACGVPVVFSAAAREGGGGAGPGIATVAAMSYPGWLAGPPVIGGLASATSLPAALGLVVLATAAMALLAGAVRPD